MDERRINPSGGTEVESKEPGYVFPEFFKELPEELRVNLAGDYSAPEGGQSPVHEVYDLLRRITDNLQNPDLATRANAGRLLHYFRMDSDAYLGRIEDAANRKLWEDHIDQLWEAAGKTANAEYTKIRDERRARQESVTEQAEAAPKYPELVETATQSTQETRGRILESYAKARRLQGYISHLSDFCSQQAEEFRSYATTLNAIEGMAPGRIQAINLYARMIERVAADPNLPQLVERLGQATTRPEAISIDTSHLDTLNPQEAQEYIAGVEIQNREITRRYEERYISLAKDIRKLFSRITEVADSVHHGAEVESGQVSNALRSMARQFDSKLEGLFGIRRIGLIPGMSLTNEIWGRVEPLGVVETEEEPKNETIASVSRQGYTFDRSVSTGNDPFGDIIQPAWIEVYKYKKPA